MIIFTRKKLQLAQKKSGPTNSDHVPALFLLMLLDVLRGAVWPNEDDELPESSSAHKKNPQPLSLFEHL